MKRVITLDQISIPSPCSADWSAMTGDEQKRFCNACGKHVYDLSAHARDKAEAIVNAHGGHLCVQFARDSTGKMLTLEDRPRRWSWAGWSAALASVLAMVGCDRVDSSTTGKAVAPGTPIYRTAGIVAAKPVPGEMSAVDQNHCEPTTTPTTRLATQPAKPGEITPPFERVIRGDVAVRPTTGPTTQP